MNKSPWQSLEEIPGGLATPEIWRERLGENFGPFCGAFLEPCEARSVEVGNEAEAADSRSNSGSNEATLQINWTKFRKALSHAFGLEHKAIELPLPGTCQIGSWSSEAIPVILTIQTQSQTFRHVICELALRLRRRFILLGPTSVHMDVFCHELLAHARAEFFGLDSHMSLTTHGSIRAHKSPGEIFAQFTPTPRQPLDEDTTRKAFALVKALDNKRLMKQPSPTTVFIFYCIDGLSVSDIARKCRCSRGTILNRLDFIRRKTGIDPNHVRQLATSLANNEEQLSDFRARHIHRKNLIYDEDAEEE